MVGGGTPAALDRSEGVPSAADGRPVAGAVRALDGPAEPSEAAALHERRGIADVVERGHVHP